MPRVFLLARTHTELGEDQNDLWACDGRGASETDNLGAGLPDEKPRSPYLLPAVRDCSRADQHLAI